MLGGPYDGLSGNFCSPGANGIIAGASSILNQPVHIATPAPSPPPSPSGTKGAKKQNYQTNQNFPFLYPPPSSSSSSVWGKIEVGSVGDAGSVPESILEAGELFLKRIRMTLAMRQLWREREEFLKHERGWTGNIGVDIDQDGMRRGQGNANINGKPQRVEEARLQSVEELYVC